MIAVPLVERRTLAGAVLATGATAAAAVGGLLSTLLRSAVDSPGWVRPATTGLGLLLLAALALSTAGLLLELHRGD